MKNLILGLLLLSSMLAQSQLTLNVGAQRTALDKSAITIDISYLKSLDTLFGNQEYFVPGKKSFFIISPQLDIQTGTDDAFSSIILKASGLFNVFKTTTIAGLVGPDYNKTFHTFPVSIGVETNSTFNNTNGIVEAGWIPYYQSYGRASPDWLKRTHFGIFLQGGYKFNADTTGIGGEVYKGEEQEKRAIFRAHGTGGFDTEAFLTIRGLSVGLIGNADAWADIVNSNMYYKLEGRARIYLTPATYFDFVIQKGSGAPLFNEETQGGFALGLKF